MAMDSLNPGGSGGSVWRRARFALLTLLSFSVALYALLAYGALPVGALVHPSMRANFEIHRLGIYTHIFASSLALLLGPAQFLQGLRTRRPALHRWLGRLYLGVGVLFGGLGGLYMSRYAFGGAVSTGGFGLLALAWLYTGVQAYRAARARHFAAHRVWMVHNSALSLAAVTLRMYLGLGLAAGLPFERIYPVIAWLCWLPNLLVAQLLVRREAGA
jgi:hypothetical protein